MAKVIGVPMTGLVNWLLTEGLDRLEAAWRDSPERLGRVADQKGTYMASRKGKISP